MNLIEDQKLFNRILELVYRSKNAHRPNKKKNLVKHMNYRRLFPIKHPSVKMLR